MRDFMYGVGFATGLIITGLVVVSWALRREYVPMGRRPLSTDDWEDCWGEWVTTTMN